MQTFLIALGAGILSVILAVAAIRLWDRRRGGSVAVARRLDLLEPAVQPMVFLFRDRMLIDATPPARALLDSVTGTGGEWARLDGWIAGRFPDAAGALDRLADNPRQDLRGPDGHGNATLRLAAEDLGSGLMRLTLTDPSAEHAGITVDSLVLQAMEEELDLLRLSMDQTPMLVWRQDADDRITWANAAYLQRAEAGADGQIAWPLPRLLDVPRTQPGGIAAPRRARLDSGGSVLWYDCHSHRAGDQTMMFALPADAAVRAERSLREFVQTLTKTFADLPTGLAIFDRERKLQLFNPALIDLTGLPTGFLTARPTLFDFLDQLREARMVPEPKDYRSWRQQMNNLESAAATGRHVETWSLPGGQTYRVTGRPHPDGAVAFLFEDITSEITLNRKYRAELSLGAMVLDGIDDGLIVFGSNGAVKTTNKAYVDIWGQRSSRADQALALWQDEADQAGPGLGALCDRVRGMTDARDEGALIGPGGRLLGWTATRLSGGRLMIRFRQSVVAAPLGEDGAAAAGVDDAGAGAATAVTSGAGAGAAAAQPPEPATVRAAAIAG
ncbi:MAG: PAS-domain containing protein [Paracoccus sp. (in: a-proteobacteria)]|nr:PAS-domain containing protein [Paracoccus sp. (in: a-proteobacteria)]